MQISGERERVKLKVNLEKYGKGLVIGLMGWTIPNIKLSMWGSSDRFVAVKFDNEIKLDVLYSSLEKIQSNNDKKEDNKGDIQRKDI